MTLLCDSQSDTVLLCLQMTSTKPYLRKKAVLIMYKVFLQFPEALRPAFPRLKEKLEDPDPGESHTPWSHMTHVHKADTQTQTLSQTWT